MAYLKWFLPNQIDAKLKKKNPGHRDHTKNDNQVSKHSILQSLIKRLISIKLWIVFELEQKLLYKIPKMLQIMQLEFSSYCEISTQRNMQFFPSNDIPAN